MKKNKKNRSDAGVKRKLWWIIGGLGAFILIVPMIFGEMGFLQYVKMQQNQKKLTQELEHLARENRGLEKKVQDLRSDPETIERLARQRLGLVRPGETVFQFSGSGEASPPGKH